MTQMKSWRCALLAQWCPREQSCTQHCAGGSYLDICFAWGISKTAFFSDVFEKGVVWPVLMAYQKQEKEKLLLHWESNLPPRGTFLCPRGTFLRPRGTFLCPGGHLFMPRGHLVMPRGYCLATPGHLFVPWGQLFVLTLK